MTKDEIRDRLVELILTTPPFALVERSACGKATTSSSALWAKHIASHLIANGVTFAEESKWIPVSERLPKCGEMVLGNTDYFFEALQWDERADIWIGQYRSYLKTYVTHWMPLPDPPKEVE